MISGTSPPVFTVAEIAAAAPDLDLDHNGVPRTTCYGVVLSSSDTDSDVHAAAEAIRDALPIVVGIAADAAVVAPDLLDALDLTLATEGADPMAVPVEEPRVAFNQLSDAVAAAPQAAIVLNQLLRSTAELDVRAGLAAEAAAYSTLLAGPEYGAWLTKHGGPHDIARSEEPVRVERSGEQVVITMSRPERRNALDVTMREALVEALAIAHAAPEVQVTLRGDGPDFSSGGDLDEFGSAIDVVSAYLVRLDRHPGWAIHQVRDRVTAHLHGACIGAGIEMPAFAGHVIAAPDTYVVLPEVSMGLIPGAGGTVSLTKRIGRWRTAWLALSGARLDTDTALAWGLVDEIASP
jgi:enoyl-CoA hydratase/carnithine racemase